jgi:iron(III) transport system permease protein
VTLLTDVQPAAGPRAGRRASRPVALLAAATAVAALMAVPLVFLLIEAAGAGPAELKSLIFRPLTWSLLWNTVRLSAVVTVACAVIGTAAAWCVERTDLPGRRVWAVLVVIPLAIPDFVVSFGWNSLWTWAHGFTGAVIVMTLAVYPLVYLPVAASLRGADPGQEEVAPSLGVSRVRTFARITLGQAKGAILGGCVLVALVLLAEFGAFEILGYQTFTTEIFTEFHGYSFAASCALSLVLVLLSLLVLAGEGALRGRGGRVTRTGPMTQRVTLPPALSGGANVSLLNAAVHTAGYGGAAGVLATVLAFPVALLAVRQAGRGRHLLERSTYLVLGMPGVVVAFALSYFTERYLAGFGYGTAALLVACYAIMFFPLALVGVKASLARAPVSLDEVARSLGQRRLAVLCRVTARLAGPGLVAAFCLVFLSAVTELTATLLLIPTGTQTLATQFWSYETNLSYSQAAPFALVMMVVAAVPSYLLGRFFQRPAVTRG